MRKLRSLGPAAVIAAVTAATLGAVAGPASAATAHGGDDRGHAGRAVFDLEGTLSRSARRRFEAHLAGCPHCTEYLAQMRVTIELAGRITPEDLTPQMQDEFIALFRRWQSGAGGQDR